MKKSEGKGEDGFTEIGFGSIGFGSQVFGEDVVVRKGIAEVRGPRRDNHEIDVEEIRNYLDDNTGKVIVGTGIYGVLKVLQETRQYLESRNIELVEAKSPEAAKIYNQEKSKENVIAIIHSTC